ncbi:MAG: cytochrome c biogenesis protein CcsA [bacterium]
MVIGVIALYMVSAIAYLYTLFTRRRTLLYVGLAALILGFALHTVKMGLYYASTDDHGWAAWLSSLSWAIAFLYLGVVLRYREMTLGGLAVPAAFVLEGYAASVPGAGAHEVQGFLIAGHIVLAMLSMGAFFLLFGASLMYIVQARELKSKRPGAWLHRLPSLDVLDDLNHKILYFGFAFLTMSLFLGSMWARAKHGTFWSLDPLKTYPLVVIWIGYALLLVSRLTRSWKGRRSAIFSMISFVAVLLAIIVHF